jgi:hypothetical protein
MAKPQQDKEQKEIEATPETAGLSKYMEVYNWTIRQNGHGVNTPQPRALAFIIRAIFRKAGTDAILEANRLRVAETTARPAVVQRIQVERDRVKMSSDRRAARIAQQGQPQAETAARAARAARVAERTGGALQARLAQSVDVAAGDTPEQEPTKRQQRKERRALEDVSEVGAPEIKVEKMQSAIKSTINTDDAKLIADMSPKQIADMFSREALHGTLVDIGMDASELEGRSDRQLAAIVKTKIAGE